jgi:hypothetical protein
MVAYGIIDETARFTDLGLQLYKLRTDEQGLYRTLANICS